MKHGKYSRTKAVRPYKVEMIAESGYVVVRNFFSTEDGAQRYIQILKEIDTNGHRYEYKITDVGSEKYI